MIKRTLSAILILLIVLPVILSAGSVLFAPESPFAEFDSAWDTSLQDAVSGEKKNEEKQPLLPEGDRYIVKFKNEASLDDIKSSLEGSDYRLLARSEHRLFAVVPSDDGFFQANSRIIDYYEPDFLRGTLAVTNDPISIPSYESLGVYTAWDTVRASEDVIVAVLDTGIDRTHEDLIDVNILAGYDAVGRVAGVYEDAIGHGTGVTGIIAATADNGLGIAGIAHGVTVLPVKVSASGSTIYSSDLISGIRFAADAGAKIINMSVGGYSSSYAEQEAINYAASKGCILIAAAGNGGNRPYADQKSYPASYDGVISVASCDANGERSDFSQYNDAVDIAAYGEGIPMPKVENGESVYITDSGTSFSCALVSGIAALTASHIGSDARFEADEFIALITDTCGTSRTDESGYGIINASDVISISQLPLITGVSHNGKYADRVQVGFNRGTATLDGEPFEDGETIMSNGLHTLVVTDGDNVRTVRFRLNYDPLSYNFKEFAAFACFEFERGNAFLDGFPYRSGDRISSSGRHEFILTDGDETVSESFALQYTLPSVYGVADGEVYDKPIEIRIIGDGSAELDGNKIYGEATVIENGMHQLTVKSGNGAVTKEYFFEMNNPNARVFETDLADATAAIDEENGFICLYGDSLVGVRIYDIASPEVYMHFLPVGRIYSHAFFNDSLLLFGDKGITVLNRSEAINGESGITKTVSIENMVLYAFGENTVYCFDDESIYTLDIETEEAVLLAEIGFACENALYSDGKFCLLSPSNDRLVRIFDCTTLDINAFELEGSAEGVPVCFGNGFLAVGSKLIDTESGETELEFCSNSALKIENGLLYTDNRIIDIASSREIASMPFPVTDMVIGNNAVYLFGIEPVCAVIASGSEGVSAFGAAERSDVATASSEAVNAFRTNIGLDAYSTPVSASATSSFAYFLLEDRNVLYRFDHLLLSESEPVPLRFSPSFVTSANGYAAVAFENESYVYLASEADIQNGVYVSLPSVCDSAFIHNGKLYATAGGRLISCNPDGTDFLVTSIRAEKCAPVADSIFILNNNVLSSYSYDFSQIISASVEGETLSAGNHIAVGRNIYSSETLEFMFATDADIIAFRADTVITENGVFDIKTREYVGSTGVFETDAAVISESNALISFGDSIISICSFSDGNEIVASPMIEGASPNGIYQGSVTLTYDIGIGYLDGEEFTSGTMVDNAGHHIFRITLPCGRSVSVPFTVEALITGIEFLVSDRTMSVGETVTLRIKYLPDGAGSLPVSFKCESDGLTVSESGTVTASKVGSYTVTASVDAEHGLFTAECTITVRDDLIAFDSDSGITIDRDRGLVLGIKPGTTPDILKEFMTAGNSAVVVNKKGLAVKEFVGTGNRIILYKENDVTDELIIVVDGDTDGDGCITAYDLYEHERILRGYYYDDEYVVSADMNKNGIVADNDFRELRNILLGRIEYPLGNAPENLFGHASVQTVSHAVNGDILDVVICINGFKYARGISGIIEYGNGLEFIEAESLGWEADALDHEGTLNFYAYSEDGGICGKAFMAFINLRFNVTATEETPFIRSEGITVAFENGCRTLDFQNSEIEISERKLGEFNIEFLNADSFDFDPTVSEYNVIIPYNSALADISVTYGENESVSVSGLAIPISGSGTVTVNHTDENGNTYFYTIRVKRDKEPRFNTDCRLETLEIEGFKLTPSFDPDITEYRISVPHGTEKINIYCVAKSSEARIVIGDTTLYGTDTPITIFVGAPDGEMLAYTVHVTVLPPEVVSAPDTSISDDGGGLTSTIIIVVIAITAFASVCVILALKNKAQNQENK